LVESANLGAVTAKDTRNTRDAGEDEIISAFVRGMVDRTPLLLRYRSPYRSEAETRLVAPQGAFWDRGYWYLAGREGDQADEVDGAVRRAEADRTAMPRLWRADRVLSIRPQVWPGAPGTDTASSFDVRCNLSRRWLASAMQRWALENPVRIRLTQRHAARLQRDWYFRHAESVPLASGELQMTFGEIDQETVLELLRWLGPGAELLEPKAWRTTLEAQLAQMLGSYRESS